MEEALEDKQLIENAQADPQHFAALYNKYVNKIYQFIYYRVKNDKDTAFDLSAEVFTRALKNLPNFQWQGFSYSAYLYRTARSLCQEQYSKKLLINIDDITIKDENPTKIKAVLDFNDAFNADSLAVFKNHLYISTASNILFKTADGTNWTLVNTKGLPASPGKIITTTNKMYAVLDSGYYTGTYYSKDGEQWRLLSKKYYIETVYQDNAYFTKNIDDNTGLYKQKQHKHFKKIGSLTNANYYGTSQGIIAVINTSTPDELSYKVYKSVNNGKFHKVDNGDALVVDVIEVNNEPLLMVSADEGYRTFLRKI